MHFVLYNNTSLHIQVPKDYDNVNIINGCSDEVYYQLVDLLHESFKERLNDNLNFDCATFSLEELKKETNNGVIIAVYQESSLVGMCYLLLKRVGRRQYGCHEYLAVSTKVKRGGIATSMQTVMVEIAKNMGLIMLTSSTATTAESSVKWHIKNGFIPFRVSKHGGKTYTSYHFFKPISYNLLLFVIKWLSPITLCLSKLIIK